MLQYMNIWVKLSGAAYVRCDFAGARTIIIASPGCYAYNVMYMHYVHCTRLVINALHCMRVWHAIA